MIDEIRPFSSEHLAFEWDYLAGIFLVLRVPVTISSLARVPEVLVWW